MFPSFNSLADREHKRIDLLERVQRRVRQANVKRAMYADAAWASDADKTITLTKSSTDSSAQTDGDLKKPASVASSAQTINATVETGTQATPDTNDQAAQATVETNDQATQDMPESQNPDVRAMPEEQKIAKRWIKQIYRDNPNWIALKIHPIKANGVEDTNRFIGKNGDSYNVKPIKTDYIPYATESGVSYKTVPVYRKSSSKFIDWVATVNHIRDLRSDGESHSLDALDRMRLEDVDQRYYNWRKKRPNEEPHPDADKTTAHEKTFNDYLNEIRLDAGNDTKLDENQARAKLLFMLSTYKGKLKGANIVVRPILKDGTVLSDATVFIDSKGDLSIKAKRELTAKVKDVSWKLTLLEFDRLTKDLTFEYQPSVGKEVTANPQEFESKDGFWFKGKQTGDESDINDDSMSMPDAEAKKIITDFYHAVYHEANTFPIDLVPYMKNGSKTDSSGRDKAHRFLAWYHRVAKKGDPGVDELRAESRLGSRLSKTNAVKFFANIDWSATLIGLIESLDELTRTATLSSTSDDVKQQIKNTMTLFEYVMISHNINVKDVQDPRDEEQFASAQRDKDVARTVKNMVHAVVWDEEGKKAAGKGLKGRGLRGAGVRAADIKSVYQTGIKRAGNGRYNLNDIQGTALASAFIYKQIGSKYIRISELNDNVLYIVRPSREKMGPRIDISKGLTEVIKDLVYNQSISQAAYDKLSVDDQKLFKEILRITHIQHAFRDELPDPLASLKMEYDKLKGELMLGNDNPDIRKQLKIICVDMYSNKLIGDSEFKDIISRLL